MILYRYTAISNEGEKISGSVFAENYKSAYQSICKKKRLPLDITQIPLSSSKKISIEDLLLFFLHIDLQLKCKVRINDAIESFLELHGNKILQSSLASVLVDLQNGVSLGEACEKCDKIFDSVIIGLLKSAEKTGKISDVISNILKFLRLKSVWKNNIRRAVAYPIFITCVAILVLIGSTVFLGPQICSLLHNFGSGDVPLLTKIIVEYLPSILKILAYSVPIFAFILISALANNKIRFFLMNYILKIPKIGDLIIKIIFWQISKILHIALDAKLDFIDALNIAIKSVSTENIKNELVIAKEKIIDGYSIAESFSEMKFIPITVISTISIGEEGTNLSSCFSHISDNQYETMILDIESLGQFLSVSLTLFTGLVFVLIICGLFLPIYSYIGIAGA